MPSDITVLLIVATAALAFATFVGGRRLLYLKQFEEHHSMFFVAASKLIDDDRTPKVVVEYLELMANTIMNEAVARHALWNMVSGRTRAFHISPPAHFRQFKDAVGGMPPELMGLLASATISFVFAVSFRSVFFGWLLRRVLFQLPQKRDRTANGTTIEKAESVLLEIEPQACAA